MVHLSWACRVFRLTRLEFLVRGLGALCKRSAQLSQLHHTSRYVFDVTVACGGPVKCWTASRCTDGSSDVPQLSRRHSPRVAIDSHDVFEAKISHLTAHMCASVWCGLMEQIRNAMTEKSAKCEALQRVHDCGSHGGRAARSTVQRPAEATPLLVDLPLLMRPRESTNDCARSFSIWSAWRSFRGVLLHHHCLTLAGPPRIHVAKQLLSGVCGMRWCGRNGIFISTWQCVRPCTQWCKFGSCV